jgi:hypothetical protein
MSKDTPGMPDFAAKQVISTSLLSSAKLWHRRGTEYEGPAAS